MVKKILLMCMISLILLAGCQNEMTTWVGGDQKAMFARIGTMVTENNEIGGVVNWYPNTNETDSELYGVYAIHHLPGTFEILNPLDRTNDDAVVKAESYIGVQTCLNEKYDEQISTIAGFKFWDIFFTEIQYDAYDNRSAVRDDEVRAIVGFRAEWKF